MSLLLLFQGAAEGVSPDVIANGNTLYAPQIDQSFSVGLIANGNTLFAPSVGLGVSPGVITNTATVYAPQVNQSFALGLISNGNTIYAPTVVVTGMVTPGAIANGHSIYAPVIIGPQELALPLLGNFPQLYPFTISEWRVVAAGTKPRRRGSTRALEPVSRGRDRGRDYR